MNTYEKLLISIHPYLKQSVKYNVQLSWKVCFIFLLYSERKIRSQQKYVTTTGTREKGIKQRNNTEDKQTMRRLI